MKASSRPASARSDTAPSLRENRAGTRGLSSPSRVGRWPAVHPFRPRPGRGGPAPRNRRHCPSSEGHSQRFTAVGADERLLLDVLAWAEDVGDRLERTIGRKMPFENRTSVSRSAKPRPTRRPASRPPSGPRRQLVQRCIIPTGSGADPNAAQEMLCRLLLDGYVLSRVPGQSPGPMADIAPPAAVPSGCPTAVP